MSLVLYFLDLLHQFLAHFSFQIACLYTFSTLQILSVDNFIYIAFSPIITVDFSNKVKKKKKQRFVGFQSCFFIKSGIIPRHRWPAQSSKCIYKYKPSSANGAEIQAFIHTDYILFLGLMYILIGEHAEPWSPIGERRSTFEFILFLR
jgi:hypothetical protein